MAIATARSMGDDSQYREFGSGPPLVFLHGGWGYELYPLDRQREMLAGRVHVWVPDRSGYGRSRRLPALEPDFHQQAAAETWAFIDAREAVRPVLWGHSDGAVIATLMALAAPERLDGVILEATHMSGHKPASREFFETIARDPDSVGERVAAILARDHGDDWRDVIRKHSLAWLRLGERPRDWDFYGGRLSDLRVPALLIHGARDPRTEPGELDALVAAVPNALILAESGHSPHSESTSADAVTESVARFLAESISAAD